MTLRAALPAPTMRSLLALRKEALQGQIAERFRAARENGTKADVKQLTASLRAVKRQLATLDRPPQQQGKETRS